jgi:hypothetical protein
VRVPLQDLVSVAQEQWGVRQHRTVPTQTAVPGSAPAVKRAQQHRLSGTLEPRCQGRHQQQSKEVTCSYTMVHPMQGDNSGEGTRQRMARRMQILQKL